MMSEMEEPVFYHVQAAVPCNNPSYVRRQADLELVEALRASEFCYVLTPRQMGKSSLMWRVQQRLTDLGCHVAVIDLQRMGNQLSREEWYFEALERIGGELGVADALADYWQEHTATTIFIRFFDALREVVLKQIATPVVILIDEIDLVRSYQFNMDEFFAGLRECYTRREQEPAMKRLTFGIFGVVAPSSLIQDPRITPFNIGQRIELDDFTPTEAMTLARGLRGTEVIILLTASFIGRVVIPI